jgi:hypothetical protein
MALTGLSPVNKLGHMKYGRHANRINVLFILGIFLAPIGYCVFDASIPTDVGHMVILGSFALGAFVIADWYHFNLTNSYVGIAWAIAVGAFVAAGALLIASVANSASLVALALLQPIERWGGHGTSLRAYLSGVGIIAVALVSVPCLFLIVLAGR